MISVLLENNSLVSLLLKHNSSVNRTDKAGNQAIHWAAVTGNQSALSLIVDYYLKDPSKHTLTFNDTNSKGETPISLAVREGHLGIVKSFLTNKVLSGSLTPMQKKDLLGVARSRRFSDIVNSLESSLRDEM